jgi:hypothetical protein
MLLSYSIVAKKRLSTPCTPLAPVARQFMKDARVVTLPLEVPGRSGALQLEQPKHTTQMCGSETVTAIQTIDANAPSGGILKRHVDPTHSFAQGLDRSPVVVGNARGPVGIG